MNLGLRYILTKRTVASFKLYDKVIQRTCPPLTSKCTVIQLRNYSEEQSDHRRLPHLMEFPHIKIPSILKTIKNWMYANFIIRPYFDQDFTLDGFIEGSKHAVQVVSVALRKNDFDALEGLVAKDALQTLKTSVSKLNDTQKQMLAIRPDDIVYAFPYQVGVMFDDADKRWVEITMCYYVVKKLEKMKDSDFPAISDHISSPENVFFLNYRFIREFTKGVEDSWCINIVNHFQPHYG